VKSTTNGANAKNQIGQQATMELKWTPSPNIRLYRIYWITSLRKDREVYIDPNKYENKKKEEAALHLQMNGWLIESHCWGVPDNAGMSTCSWCGLRYKYGKVVRDTIFPMCESNPQLNEYILKLLREEES
jgi:hypothetical protein